jgi:alkylhydroperoxidase family enzyme
VFTPLEREVMEYAEAMSHTPPTVTDDLSHRLLDQLGAPALVELTAFIGWRTSTPAPTPRSASSPGVLGGL